ncbi:MAG: M23 family metallopeptidase [Hyphomicrobiales bacterium]
MARRPRPILAIWLSLLAPHSAGAFELAVPVDCAVGTACFIQQYVDHDPGPGARDYRCGSAVYDGHDGTDIRVRSTAEAGTVPVVAAAPGVVKAVRDGVEDHLMRTDADRQAVGNRECGNGVVIDHAGGYQTQYCHLFKGSVSVKPGDTVDTGAKLGTVGYSGAAQYPHVHLTVRKDGTVIDPFAPEASPDSCSASADPASLWSEQARRNLAYHPTAVLDFGFTDAPLTLADLETGRPATVPADSGSAAIVVYVRAINVPKDAKVTLSLDGPGGTMVDDAQVVDRSKAQLFRFAGKKRPTDGWQAGDYTARLEIVTGAGEPLVTEERTLALPH